MDYDHDELGVGSSLHPANQNEYEDFASTDLQECLDYLKETKDSEPLENAIIYTNTKIEKASSNIQFLIDVASQSKNAYFKNELIKIKKLLNE